MNRALLVASKSTGRWRQTPAWAIGIAALIATGLVSAQAVDNDYYTTKDITLLRTVERYHVVPAEEKIRTKFYSSARGDLDFVLRYFPNHPKGLLLMAQLCADGVTQHCDLDFLFEKAIDINPNVAGTYVTQGVYLHRVKRYREAIASYQRALAIDPNSINGHYNLALAYLDTKQYGLANEEAQRAYAQLLEEDRQAGELVEVDSEEGIGDSEAGGAEVRDRYSASDEDPLIESDEEKVGGQTDEVTLDR